MHTPSTRRVLIVAASSALSAALLAGVAFAGLTSPVGVETVVPSLPGPAQAVAMHMGIGRGGDLIDAALTYIGITRDQYLAGIQAGKSLTQLATENGKTRDGLIAAMVAAGTAALDAAKAELPAKAAEVADSTRPAGGPGFGPGGFGRRGR